jgi:hypothetical protein
VQTHAAEVERADPTPHKGGEAPALPNPPVV